MATTSAQHEPSPHQPAQAPTPAQPEQPQPQQPPTDDPFDSLLTLEDDFYTQGYNQGMADGLVAGRTEGRQLGYERGFQKFVESGRLQGRAIVWANRLRLPQQQQQRPVASSSSSSLPSSETGTGTGTGAGSGSEDSGSGGSGGEVEAKKKAELPPLPQNPRLAKHVSTLYALAETESLSIENTDAAVDDFDDRLRRAQGRAKIIERMVGEGGEKQNGDEAAAAGQGHDPEAGGLKGEGVEV